MMSSAAPVTTSTGTSSLSCHSIRRAGICDETLPDIYKQAEFCSMCGPKHCPMQTKITENLEGLEFLKQQERELTTVKLDKAD